MMNSTADDDFSPNPFRSGGGNGDLFGGQGQARNSQQPTQQFQQQPQFNQQPQQQMQFSQQQYPPQQQQQFQPQQQQQFQAAGSDPFAPIQQQQMPQPPPPNQTNFQQPMMSGQMDGQVSNQQQQTQTRSWWGSCMVCLSLDAYRAYFDIDAEDIVKRIKAAVLDCYKPEYFRNEVVGPHRTDSLKGPDLYGPFWITMTLIFFVGVTGNVHAYLHRDKGDDVEEFEYDINHLLRAASILCTYAFVLPTVLWLTTQCMSMQALLLVEWVCFYGYSLVPFLPAVVICVIPFGLVSTVVLIVATLMSCCLIIRNVASALLSSDVGQAKAPPLIMAILGTHAIFFFFMKFSFYHKKVSSSSSSSD